MSQTSSSAPRRIVWESVITVLSAAVLISAEVFGAAFAGGWALASLIGLGDYGIYTLQVVFFLLGVAVMIGFVRNAMRVEPFTARR
jgi:2-methylisocitrate lyase-like PEP mutase family enzyme